VNQSRTCALNGLLAGMHGRLDCFHVLDFGCVFAFTQLELGCAVGGSYAVFAGSGQAREHLPCGGLLCGVEMVVGALGAACDGPFDAVGPFIIGEGESGPGLARQAWSSAWDSSGSALAPRTPGWLVCISCRSI
jgi:hypothetical protein